MLFEVNDWMATHFGKNPNNGGRPPKDINRAAAEIWNVILDFVMENICILEKMFFDASKMIIGVIIKM